MTVEEAVATIRMLPKWKQGAVVALLRRRATGAQDFVVPGWIGHSEADLLAVLLGGADDWKAARARLEPEP